MRVIKRNHEYNYGGKNEDATHLAHTLKGVSGNIGALELHVSAENVLVEILSRVSGTVLVAKFVPIRQSLSDYDFETALTESKTHCNQEVLLQ
jgi:HPt (histidine-containing phosphotransfer) domain-containing protein